MKLFNSIEAVWINASNRYNNAVFFGYRVQSWLTILSDIWSDSLALFVFCFFFWRPAIILITNLPYKNRSGREKRTLDGPEAS